MVRHWQQVCFAQVSLFFVSFSILLFSFLLPCATCLANVPEKQNELLQFTTGGHVLGFQSDAVFVASGDHALRVDFVDTQGVKPIADSVASGDNKAQPMSKVAYPGLWSGIDLVYEAKDSGILESTWTIAPNADPEQIRLNYNAPVEIEKDGSLRVSYATGWMRESKPIAWQEIDGHRIPVEATFIKPETEDNATISFMLGKYDPTHPLLIDPVMEWNTFMGGTNSDYANAIATDDAGNIYVAGFSKNSWGSPINLYAGNDDIFVAKLNPAGVLQWNTFMGSVSEHDRGDSIAVDGSGNIYVIGHSYSAWGSPIDDYEGEQDIVVAKLNTAGVRQWHTFMGSTSYDFSHAIAVDNSGNIYVAGDSYASWGSSPVDPWVGTSSDGFVAKLNTAGERLWNTFLGDKARAIVVDSLGNSYVAGMSNNSWGSPTTIINPHTGGNNSDVHLAKLSTSGARLWNTFMGSTGLDYAYGVAIDSAGNIYVAGSSLANWGAPINTHTGDGEHDGFVSKLNSAGARQWNTFMGSTGTDITHAIAVDSAGAIYVAGESNANWGSPTTPYAGGADAYAAKFNNSGVLVWNTFMGSSNNDYGNGITVDGANNIYMTGRSAATWGSPLNAHTASFDVFVAKITNVCTEAPSDLIGWWGGDGNAVDMVGTADGTLVGDTTYVDGVVGQAFSFDGSGDYVSLPESTDWNFGTNSFSISAWFKTTMTGRGNIIRYHHSSGGGFWGVRMEPGGIVELFIADATGAANQRYIQSNSTYNDGTWHYVSAVRDAGTGQLQLYIDGVSAASAVPDGGLDVVATTGAYPTIGRAGNFNSEYFEGLIDELHINSGTLSLVDHQAVVNAGSAGKCRSCAAQPSGIVAWWQGEDNANDFTGTNNGTLMNSTGFTAGMVRQAFDFEDSTNDYIEVPHSTSLDITGAYSAEGWILLDTQAQGYIFSKLDANGTPSLASYTMPTEATGQIGGGLYGSYPADYYLSTAPQIETGAWRHVAFTWDGTTANSNNVKLYLDGRLIESWTKTSTLNSTIQSLTLGATKPPYPRKLDGQIDELTIYNTELTAAEIASIANARNMGKCGAFYTVSTNAPAAEGSFTPTSQTVNHGDTASFTVTPEAGYAIDTVTGCGGTWTGSNPYITDPITADCTVSATFITTHTVGGSVSGLAAGNSVVLQNNGGDNLTVSADSFTFATALDDGSAYAVTVLTQPTTPNQTCTVSSGSGTVPGADVTDVSVTCVTNTYTVGGSVSGLAAGNSVVLQNNGGDNLTVSANDSFTFATALDDESTYTVTVDTQPTEPNQTCTVTNGSDTLAGANVTTVTVTCVTNTYTVSTSAPTDQGSFTPEFETVDHGETTTFDVTAEEGYTIDTVTGCGGAWTGANPYETGPITADCTVEATFSVPEDCTFFIIRTPDGKTIPICL